jgi:hypothetical protein
MALLRYKGKEKRELATYGIFKPGDTKIVPDMVARNLVITRPDMWSIDTSESDYKKRQKAYNDTKKLDKKTKEA